MKIKKTLIILLCFPIIGFGQSHFIDDYSLQMFGDDINNDIYINTYYNSLDTCSVLWNIIYDSLPSQWEFSICFPNCYNVGIIAAQDLFLPNNQVYLNCHMYPNGQGGEGIIKIEITTNNIYKDTVTWHGTINNITLIPEVNILKEDNKKLIKVFDFSGKELQLNTKPFIEIYDDGSVEKKMILE